MTTWNQYLKDYRTKHPNMPFREAQKKAGIQYKKDRPCTATSIRKKMSQITEAQKDKICNILDAPPNKKTPVKKAVKKPPSKKAPSKKPPAPSGKYYNPNLAQDLAKRYPDSSVDSIKKVFDKFENAVISNNMYTGLYAKRLEGLPSLKKYQANKKQPLINMSQQQLKSWEDRKASQMEQKAKLDTFLKNPGVYKNNIFGEWFVNRLLMIADDLVEVLFYHYKYMRGNIAKSLKITAIPDGNQGTMFTEWIKRKLDRLYESDEVIKARPRPNYMKTSGIEEHDLSRYEQYDYHEHKKAGMSDKEIFQTIANARKERNARSAKTRAKSKRRPTKFYV